MSSTGNVIKMPSFGNGALSERADRIDAGHAMVKSLVEVFDEPNPLARRHAVHQIFTRDCLVSGPDQALMGIPHCVPRPGWDGVTLSARRLQDSFQDHFFSVREALGLDDKVILLRWSYGPIWDHTRYLGINIGLCVDSRIQALRSLRETASDAARELGTASRTVGRIQLYKFDNDLESG